MRPVRDWLARERGTALLAWIGVVTTIGMFIVIGMGDLVTNAGAAQGCGRSWPLCNGRLVPIFTLDTLIEFSHRFVVGIVSVGVLVLAAGTLLRTPGRQEAQVLAPGMVVFLVLQAVLGGLAVIWPQTPAVLALHMGISLISFSTVFLTTMLLLGETSWDAMRDEPVLPAFRRLVWLVLAYLYALIYVGAYVRHSNAMLSCAGWPLCNGQLVPALGSASQVWVNFGHRIGALIGVGLFFLLCREGWSLRRRRPDLAVASAAAVVFLFVQILAGGAVALSGFALWSALAHGALLTPVFGAVSYLCLQVLPRPRGRISLAAGHPAPDARGLPLEAAGQQSRA